MQEIHISPNGSDMNPGTREAPLKNLASAQKKVRDIINSFGTGHKEDITVKLDPGIYRLTETLVMTPEDGGDGTFKVTWQGSKSGQSEISSGKILDGWQPFNEDMKLLESARGRVWFVDLPAGTEVKTLYGKNGIIPRARSEAIKPERISLDGPIELFGPDGPSKGAKKLKEGDPVWYHDRFKFTKGAILPADDLDEVEFLIIPANQWIMNILPMGKIDFENSTVHLGKNCTYPIGIPHCAQKGSIWLENSLSFIKPGSWVYHKKASRLYFCPEEEEPEAGLETALLTEFIRVEGVYEIEGEKNPCQGIHFKNLDFSRSKRFSFHGLTGKGIQHDWEMYDAPSCMLRFRHTEECSVSDCHFHDGDSGGLRMDLACRNNRVENCEFNNLGGCGVVLCGYGLSRNYLNRKNKILNNHIHHIGESHWHSPAIFIWQSGDNHIANNYLHHTPYTALVCSGRTVYDRNGKGECSGTIDWNAVDEQCGKDYEHNAWFYSGLVSWWMREPLMHSRENLIEYNRIHDVMQILGDGNGIYISGAGGGNVVRFNVVGPCPSPNMCEAIRCDDDQHHTIIHGNLIYRQGGRATGITLKGINRVTNNILALPLNATFRGMLSLETGPLNGSVIKHNIFYTSAENQKFVSEIRIHGQGRKARIMDAESDENIYFCTAGPEIGRAWLEECRSFGSDINSLCCSPGFVNAENGDYNLEADAPALKIGFQPLPLEKMMETFCKQ